MLAPSFLFIFAGAIFIEDLRNNTCSLMRRCHHRGGGRRS
jgi:hypothetical protein